MIELVERKAELLFLALLIAVFVLWWREAVADRLKWISEDLLNNDSEVCEWDKVPTGEWLAPARKNLRGRR